MEPLTAQQLSELSSRELLMKLDELKAMAIEKGAAWAEAKEKFRNLDRLTETILAEFQREYFKQDPDLGVTKAKVMALCNPNYKVHLKKVNEAEKEANLLQAEFAIMKKAIEALTAIGFVRNNELKLSR